MTIPDPIRWGEGGTVRILDQTLLPGEERYLELDSVDAVAEAIRALRVRGAPLIGIAAAMGVTLAGRHGTASVEQVHAAAAQLRATRPTAVNLAWALERMERRAAAAAAEGQDLRQALRDEADAIRDEDRAMCARIGAAGAALIGDDAVVLTHCNAGALATGGIGTALAPIYTLHDAGRRVSVVACETRPLLQGSRLTAWELERAGIPVTVLVDAAAASLMRERKIDLCIVGADRIAENGDVANKIGTLPLALAARYHGVPFYVAAPTSTLDPSTKSGDRIHIEQRGSAEVTSPFGTPTAPAGVGVYNPAFDVTPADLITAIVTDEGIFRPPYRFAATT